MLTWNEQIFAPRRHDHLLVIPVINEGERLRRQLERIAAAAPEIDIMIADGGSTDHSLDPAVLAGLGVRALLTKTSEGKLSAQLRMAYNWAADEIQRQPDPPGEVTFGRRSRGPAEVAGPRPRRKGERQGVPDHAPLHVSGGVEIRLRSSRRRRWPDHRFDQGG